MDAIYKPIKKCGPDMRIKFNKNIMHFEDFAAIYDLTVVILQSEYPHYGKYYARFDDIETKDGVLLTSETGHGDTPEDAVVNYIKNIAGKLLVKNAYQSCRMEFLAPAEFIIDLKSLKQQINQS